MVKFNPTVIKKFQPLKNSAGDASSKTTDKNCKNTKKSNENEAKYEELSEEYEKLNIELAHEKNKVKQLEKKLQFVRDNQKVFTQLKEAYITMKYGETTAGKLSQKNEEKCVQTQDLPDKASDVVLKAKESSISVTKDELDKLYETLQNLKSIIDQREKSWSLNVDEQINTAVYINSLEKENDHLKKLLDIKIGDENKDTLRKDKFKSKSFGFISNFYQ